ncbi:TPA: hypothetical protein TZY53_000669 [Streptococcus suis]|uniref:hypothetical protein n=1 Tax=Streptococcus suis TaxID=1307 RepID=UPI000945952B|nr:hypothetical protein [Streptococcus suis]MDW8671966.1 hypothetical protein [Streptococcus suis]HEL2363780.1 hypothetical protein [Streptococcus suis]HEL2457750.1 hypothetical protein [Streptococcus suis]HEM3867788.1 hypothetical protein [Streptococcus suis]HEM3871217.1 hypothetical protein [Streptococcus suis]
MKEIVLSEHDVNALINKGKVSVMIDGENAIIRQSYIKDVKAEMINWDNQVVSLSDNIVRNRHFDSFLRGSL